MMARLNNGTKSTIDDTFPLTCIIESSQLVEGHGEYSIRVSRLSNDPLRSWIVTKRFREFDDLNNILKDLGYEFDLPPKRIIRRTEPTFMAERQKGLQTYLDVLVKQYELCNSLLIQRFLDPENHIINHSELALQYTSMFLRSTNNMYQIVEQLPDLGWRYTKTYFLATKAGAPKDDRYLLSWCQYGLDKTFADKDVTNYLKLLKSISHHLFVPIDEIYANESGALVIYRYYSKGSLKDYLNQTKPTGGSYWKRYGRKTNAKGCDLNRIKTYGRHILEALNFIYENGLVYGHLHSGNLFFDSDQSYPIKLFDIANAIIGVSSKYRCYISDLKQIRTLEQCDIYAFGRVLYELSTGQECPTSICTQFPNTVPIPVQHILYKILSPTGDLPSIQELLNDSFFQGATSGNIERFQLKLHPKAKEAFEQISRTAQTRLEDDQTKIKNARRTKTTSQFTSEEEKLKRRRERQLRAAGLNSDPNLNVSGSSKTIQRSISVEPLTAGQTSPRRPLTSNVTVDIPETSAAAAPPPPPRPPAPTVKRGAAPPPPSAAASPPATGDRSQLLSSITDFSVAKLKKAKTNDRSAPKIK